VRRFFPSRPEAGWRPAWRSDGVGAGAVGATPLAARLSSGFMSATARAKATQRNESRSRIRLMRGARRRERAAHRAAPCRWDCPIEAGARTIVSPPEGGLPHTSPSAMDPRLAG